MKTSKILRPWQEQALSKAVHWLLNINKDRHFLINAAPGSGKTVSASIIAQYLIERDEIDRVIVIAPRSEVVKQWASEFKAITGRFMGKVTGSDDDPQHYEIDLCATWAAIKGLATGFQEICRTSRTLVICDEHHHAAIAAAWGNSADSAFKDAKFVLILSGTPIRSDGERPIWVAHDENGLINHPEAGTFTLSYGDAVDLGYCRPVSFHRHEGTFDVCLDENKSVQVSGAGILAGHEAVQQLPSLKKALNFYKLAQTPQFINGTEDIPDLTGYQASMVEVGSNKLDEIRCELPNAGGLVIAPNIKMAEYFCQIIKKIEGEEAILVHSNNSGSDQKIAAFKATDKRWLVSVAMVSEGVDIPRLRVLIFLPNSQTELFFRQSIGRIVRTMGMEDQSRGHVIMPAFNVFDKFAQRIESEMPASLRKAEKPSHKKCPICESLCAISDETCNECGYEFKKKMSLSRQKSCENCGSLNALAAESCLVCGEKFKALYTIALKDALRDGVIVRGVELSEDEVLEAEKIAPAFRNNVLKSGDERLIKLLSQIPPELTGRLKAMLT